MTTTTETVMLHGTEYPIAHNFDGNVHALLDDPDGIWYHVGVTTGGQVVAILVSGDPDVDDEPEITCSMCGASSHTYCQVDDDGSVWNEDCVYESSTDDDGRARRRVIR